VRRQVADAIGMLCRKEGYLSFHDDVRERLVPPRVAGRRRLAKVIPLFRRSQRG